MPFWRASRPAGFHILALRMRHLRETVAEGFYEIHRARPFFGELVQFMTRSPVVVAVLEKDSAVTGWRDFMGATDPAKAVAGSIRKQFGSNVGEIIAFVLLAALSAVVLFAQDITGWIKGGGGKPALAVPDFRASGGAQPLMVHSTRRCSSFINRAASTCGQELYPPNNPQPAGPSARRQHRATRCRTGAARPRASHLVFGYAAAINGALAIYGNVYDTRVTIL